MPFLALARRASPDLVKLPEPRAGLVPRLGRGAVVVCLASIPVLQVVGGAFVFARNHAAMEAGGGKLFYVGPEWTGWSEAGKWIGDHSRHEDVVANSDPQLFYLRTGRKSVLPPMEIEPRTAQRYADSVPLRYVILGSFKFLDVDARVRRADDQGQPNGVEARVHLGRRRDAGIRARR